MRSDRLTVKAQEIIQDAETLSYKYNHSAIEPEHVLLCTCFTAGGDYTPSDRQAGSKPGNAEKRY